MAIQDMSAADLAAVVGDNDGFGNGNGWWIILLFLFLGWGNNGWGNNGGANSAEAWSVYPLMENQQNLFTGFGNLTNAVTSGFANAETAATARQMADMQQMFSLSQQLSQCCCENRLATAEQTATILAENCADRQAISDGVRDILANQTASVQRILDQMCQDKIDAKNEEIANLRQQVNMMNLAASQTVQTAQLIADNAAQTQLLRPTPIPAYVVANPNTATAATS